LVVIAFLFMVAASKQKTINGVVCWPDGKRVPCDEVT
jgi:hypothetical protein